MKKARLFIKKLIHTIKREIPVIIEEINNGDGYTFKTNFAAKDKTIYKSALKELGLDYRISNYATDILGNPIDKTRAIYTKGDLDFMKLIEILRVKRNKKKPIKGAKVKNQLNNTTNKEGMANENRKPCNP